MEIKTAKELGYKGRRHYCWCGCVGCGKKRWVVFRKGNPESLRCKPCASFIRRGDWYGELSPDRLQYLAKWRANHPGYFVNQVRNWRLLNPEKLQAQKDRRRERLNAI